MKDRLLRFDTFVAACALLMSTITAGAMVYQTHVIEEQFAATVWPYVEVDTTFNPTSVDVRLVNDGAGPALIRSAQLFIDGQAVTGWSPLVRRMVADAAVVAKHGSVSMASSSTDASTTIRAGDAHSLIFVRVTNRRVIPALAKHHVALTICYCSINGQCWNLHDEVAGGKLSIPAPVRDCTIGPSIAAAS